MLFILIAAIFSVTVSVSLKIYKKYNLDIFQILTFNYLVASALAMFWFKPSFSVLNASSPWWLIALLSVLLPVVFWCLNQSLSYAGLIKTEIAQRISVVLTILVSALIYQEQFNAFKILGIVLGLVAVLCLILGKSAEQSQTTHQPVMWWSLIGVWGGYACIDLLFKSLSTQGMQFSVSLTLIFIFAGVLMLLWNFFRKTKWDQRSMMAGALLGLLNFANIAFYLQAHQVLKNSPAVVFATMNILVVVLGVGAAILIFNEVLNRSKLLGCVFAISAVYCLMQSMLL